MAGNRNSVVGFYFHVRGIQRKPGGWRLPVVNIVMGPPVFAPLLFGVSGYLGLIASFLRRGGDSQGKPPSSSGWIPPILSGDKGNRWSSELREAVSETSRDGYFARDLL
jgi:hypothetical protein